MRLCDNPLTCANIGLGFGWTLANLALLTWSWRMKPPFRQLLRVMRISVVIMMVAAAGIGIAGISVGAVLVPCVDAFGLLVGWALLRLNMMFRRMYVR